MGALPLMMMVAAAPLQAPDVSDPANIVREAVAAVEADTVSIPERRWNRALARDPRDRTAALGLATLAHYTYRDSAAERFYALAAAAAPIDRIGGYAVLGLARLRSLRNRWAEADSLATLAAEAGRAADDAKLIGEALVVRASAPSAEIGFAAALEILAEAEATFPADDYRGRATARCAAARKHYDAGDPRATVTAAREGAELAGRAGDLRSQGLCQLFIAVGYEALFLADTARAAFDRAIAAFREARDRAGLAIALQWRAGGLRLTGQLARARRDAAEAVREAEIAGRRETAAWSRLILAQIALAFGDVVSARREIDAIKRGFETIDDPRGRVVIASLEANVAMVAHDPTGAREAFERVTRLSSAIGWPEAGLSGWTGLVWAALAANDSAAAYSAMDTARARLMRPMLGGHTTSLSLLEGTLALRYGRPIDAERIFRDRIAKAPSRGRGQYLNRVRLAEVLVELGRLEEAEREIVRAAEELDAWRQTLDDRRLRLLAFQRTGDLADPDAGVPTVVAALARNDRLASAFNVVERRRARDLADRLRRAAAIDTISADHAVRDEPTRELEQFMTTLPDDSTAVLEYVTGRGDPTTVFVITRRRAAAYVLAGQDSLGQLIERFNVLLASGDDPRELGRQLGAALLAPALDDLDPTVRRLIIVPDGALHRLPFDALVLPDGRYVIERFAVTAAPSAAVLVHLWERRPAHPPTQIAVLADPHFANETRAAFNTEAFGAMLDGEIGLPRLRGSSREARAVARYAATGATVRRRDDANEAWLKRAPLDAFGVIHFATHAVVDESSVANTALALAPAEGEDGFLRPAELANLTLAAELVVLSACRTARGVLIRGEGVQGLAAPLLAAGARAVAATWWPIGDVATVRFVDDFYRAMAEGLAAADALRAAKLTALRRNAPPIEWAAFTLVGDPLARPPLRVPNAAPWPMLGALAAAVLVIVGYGAMRRRRVADRRVPSSSTALTHQR